MPQELPKAHRQGSQSMRSISLRFRNHANVSRRKITALEQQEEKLAAHAAKARGR